MIPWLLVAAMIGTAWNTDEGMARDQLVRLGPSLTSPNDSVRTQAEAAFLRAGPAASAVLLDLATGEDKPVAEAARRLLPRLGPQAIRSIYLGARGSKGEAKRPVAVQAIVAMGDAAFPQLRELVDSGGYDEPWFATGTLGEMGRAGIAELCRLMQHREPAVRLLVADKLLMVEDERATMAFRQALQDEDPPVRAAAARALGRRKDSGARRELTTVLSDSDPGSREAAATALGQVYGIDARDALVRAARSDPSPRVRAFAASALADQAADPFAVRLGMRYGGGGSSSGALDSPMALSESVAFTLTWMLIYWVIWVSQPETLERVRAMKTMWMPGLFLLLVGYYWGCLATGVSAWTETVLLVVCFPVGLAICWLAGPRGLVMAFPAATLGLLVVGLILAPLGGLVILILAAAMGPLMLAASAVPALAAAYALGRTVDAPRMQLFRTRALLGGVMLYVGYGVGWLRLWGHI